MQKLDVRFRVPEGEEMTDERLEALAELGIEDKDVFFDEDGEVRIRMRFDDGLEESDVSAEIEDTAERIADVTGDMDLIDFDFAED